MKPQKQLFFFVILLLGILAGVYYFQKPSDHNESIQNGLQLAAKKQKIVFVKVGESWCPPCVEMEKLLSSSPRLKELLKSFIFVKTGLNNPELKPLQISAIPFLIFYAPDGKEIARNIGFLQEKDMVAFLEKVLKERQ